MSKRTKIIIASVLSIFVIAVFNDLTGKAYTDGSSNVEVKSGISKLDEVKVKIEAWKALHEEIAKHVKVHGSWRGDVVTVVVENNSKYDLTQIEIIIGNTGKTYEFTSECAGVNSHLISLVIPAGESRTLTYGYNKLEDYPFTYDYKLKLGDFEVWQEHLAKIEKERIERTGE